MNDQEDDAAPRYVTILGDVYIAQRDDYAFYLSSVYGLEYATGWLDKLIQTEETLPEFPGPLSHARDEDASAFFGREVRRLLYHGPSRRRSKQPCRILFTLTPPDDDEPDGETVIFLLRLLRGGQSLRDMNDEPEDPNSP